MNGTSLDVNFIRGHIFGRSCKKKIMLLALCDQHPTELCDPANGNVGNGNGLDATTRRCLALLTRLKRSSTPNIMFYILAHQQNAKLWISGRVCLFQGWF